MLGKALATLAILELMDLIEVVKAGKHGASETDGLWEPPEFADPAPLATKHPPAKIVCAAGAQLRSSEEASIGAGDWPKERIDFASAVAMKQHASGASVKDSGSLGAEGERSPSNALVA